MRVWVVVTGVGVVLLLCAAIGAVGLLVASDPW